MSQMEFSSDGEFNMAVAAAAYAIVSMDEKGFLNKKSPLEVMEISDISKSKRGGNTSTQIYSKGFFKWSSSKKAKDDSKSAGSKKFGSGNEAALGPKAQSPKKPTILSSSSQKKEGNTARTNKLETEADTWEKAKIAEIRTRYEKKRSKILHRQTKKKMKANQRLEQKMRGTPKRRAKALQKYQKKISRIEKNSAQERVLVDKRERNDVLKIREMAKQMRSTGDIPHACVCF